MQSIMAVIRKQVGNSRNRIHDPGPLCVLICCGFSGHEWYWEEKILTNVSCETPGKKRMFYVRPVREKSFLVYEYPEVYNSDTGTGR